MDTTVAVAVAAWVGDLQKDRSFGSVFATNDADMEQSPSARQARPHRMLASTKESPTHFPFLFLVSAGRLLDCDVLYSPNLAWVRNIPAADLQMPWRYLNRVATALTAKHRFVALLASDPSQLLALRGLVSGYVQIQ